MILNRELRKRADQQWGYFTSRQALKAGYPSPLHTYHVKSGNWQHVDWALYRIAGYEDTLESEFTRWSLWASATSQRRVCVISHESALHYYGLSSRKPGATHLSVSSVRLHANAEGCVLHSEQLGPTEYLCKKGFWITTPLKTLLALQPDLILSRQWETTVRQAGERGLLAREDEARLLGENTMRKEAGGAGVPVTSGVQERRMGGYMTRSLWNQDRPGGCTVASRSFTLVEMLVVIAIIMVLAGLLMPMLQKGVDSARQTQCLGNFKQLGACFAMYTDENNGYLPWCYLVGTPGSSALWHSRVYRYADATLPNDPLYTRIDQVGLYCPSAIKNGFLSTSYAMNSFAGGINAMTGMSFPHPPYRHLKMQRVTKPNQIYLAGEKEANTTASGYGIGWPQFPAALNQGSYEYRIGLHHKGDTYSNWLFFDLHVESRDGYRTWSWLETGGYLNSYY